MRKFIAIFVLLLSFLCCKQSNYEIIKGEDGSIYRLNNKTGEMVVLRGDKSVPVETPESLREKREKEKLLSEPKIMRETQVPGRQIFVKLITSWRGNLMNYKFFAYPYMHLTDAKSPTYLRYEFNVSLCDKNGFTVKTINIPLTDMIITVDDNGNPIFLDKSSSIDCDLEEYEAIESYSISWKLPPVHISEKKGYKEGLLKEVKDLINQTNSSLIKSDENGDYVLLSDQKKYLKSMEVYDLILLKSELEQNKDQQKGQ